MAEFKKSEDIGLGQAFRLCNLPADKRLRFISEGLPIILQSARSLLKASRELKDSPREAEILRRLAEEECVKILILMDVIRCPTKIISSRLGKIMKWFYDHLARLTYVESQSWKPMNVRQLQEYVDTKRRSHFLEGEYGEYILPNWALFTRESALYADVMCDEDGEPNWCSPLEAAPGDYWHDEPLSYVLSEGLEAIGAFSEAGLRIVRDVWGEIDFNFDMDWSPTRELYRETLDRLDTAALITNRLTDLQARMLANNWQLPMYHIDFTAIPVSIEHLKAQREQEPPVY